MAAWQLGKSASRIRERWVGSHNDFLEEQLSKLILQVKRILVPQRENPIINRLNKTKVEKFPDLQMEREEKLKALRKKDQAVRLARVSFISVYL